MERASASRSRLNINNRPTLKLKFCVFLLQSKLVKIWSFWLLKCYCTLHDMDTGARQIDESQKRLVSTRGSIEVCIVWLIMYDYDMGRRKTRSIARTW